MFIFSIAAVLSCLGFLAFMIYLFVTDSKAMFAFDKFHPFTKREWIIALLFGPISFLSVLIREFYRKKYNP